MPLLSLPDDILRHLPLRPVSVCVCTKVCRRLSKVFVFVELARISGEGRTRFECLRASTWCFIRPFYWTVLGDELEDDFDTALFVSKKNHFAGGAFEYMALDKAFDASSRPHGDPLVSAIMRLEGLQNTCLVSSTYDTKIYVCPTYDIKMYAITCTTLSKKGSPPKRQLAFSNRWYSPDTSVWTRVVPP